MTKHSWEKNKLNELQLKGTLKNSTDEVSTNIFDDPFNLQELKVAIYKQMSNKGLGPD